MAAIIAAHDLSGAGRCSLLTALAVLSAAGHTCHPLPTALLSQQTGLPGYSFVDFTPFMPDYLRGWRDLKLDADVIYTGFLGNGKQTRLLSDLIAEYPDALVLVDPVMGDNAGLYDCYDESFVEDMRFLAKSAHILLPNVTEFNLLTGIPPEQEFPSCHKELLSRALSIDAPRLQYIVITSADASPGSKHEMCNLLVDLRQKSITELPCSNNGVSYSGAGDLFASVFCGLIANKAPVKYAVEQAANFVADAVKTMPCGADTRFGIKYEPLLHRLANLSGGFQHAKQEN